MKDTICVTIVTEGAHEAKPSWMRQCVHGSTQEVSDDELPPKKVGDSANGNQGLLSQMTLFQSIENEQQPTFSSADAIEQIE